MGEPHWHRSSSQGALLDRLVRSLRPQQSLTAERPLQSLAWTPDGALLVAAGGEQANLLGFFMVCMVFELKTLKILWQQEVSKQAFLQACLGSFLF
jgi:hypothetical protein